MAPRRFTFMVAFACLGLGAAVGAATVYPLLLAPATDYRQFDISLVLLAASLALTGIVVVIQALPRALPSMKPGGAMGSLRARMPRVAFLGAYLALLAWFKFYNVWGAHFSESGAQYVIYTLARAAFMLYLAVVLIESGKMVSDRFTARASGAGTARPLLLDAFYLGAAIWVLGGYLLGLAHGIYWAPLAAITSVLVWRGYPTALRFGEAISSGIAGLRPLPLVTLAWTCVLLCSLGLVVALIAINMGLAVTGFEYDSSGHYLPYFAQAVSGHSTAPNEYWYHFWVSKGAFLHLLAVALTDIQGPQLVSFMMLLAALAAAHGVLRDATGEWKWGIAGAVVLAAPFISHFTYFQKHHIVSLGLTAGMLWLSRPGLSVAAGGALWQTWALALIGAALVCNVPPMAGIVLPYCLCFGVWLWWRRGLPLSRAFLPLSGSSISIAAILCLNQAWTGLSELNPIYPFWRFADQEKLSQYASPYVVLFLLEGAPALIGRASLSMLSSLHGVGEQLVEILPVRALSPVVAASFWALVLAGVAAPVNRKFRQAFAEHLGPAFALISIATAVGVVVSQGGSMARLYTFAYYPLVIVVVGSVALLWWKAKEYFVNAAMRNVMQFVCAILSIGLALGSSSYWIANYLYANGRWYLQEKVAFLAGQRSFEQALTYEHRRTDSPASPRRELSENCLGIQQFLSDRKHAQRNPPPKVWSLPFLQEAGCHILPHVQIQMEFSTRFGTSWHRIVFGEPAEALRELDRIGVRYFYLNLADPRSAKTEAVSSFLYGCLAYSPLFERQSLKAHFQIVWSADDAYLLVLRAQETTGSDITDDFVEKLDRKASTYLHGLGDMSGICSRLAGYYRAQGERWPVSVDASLPPLKGWGCGVPGQPAC